MAITLQNMDSSKVISSLDTYNYTIPSSGMYMISSMISEIPTSSVSVLIKQNGVTKATSSAPTTAQQEIDLQILLNCATSDVISFVISSSAAREAAPNQIKGILNIRPGSV